MRSGWVVSDTREAFWYAYYKQISIIFTSTIFGGDQDPGLRMKSPEHLFFKSRIVGLLFWDFFKEWCGHVILIDGWRLWSSPLLRIFIHWDSYACFDDSQVLLTGLWSCSALLGLCCCSFQLTCCCMQERSLVRCLPCWSDHWLYLLQFENIVYIFFCVQVLRGCCNF